MKTLKKYRLEYNMSQTELSENSKVSLSSVKNYEQSEDAFFKASVRNVFLLSNCIGKIPEDFFDMELLKKEIDEKKSEYLKKNFSIEAFDDTLKRYRNIVLKWKERNQIDSDTLVFIKDKLNFIKHNYSMHVNNENLLSDKLNKQLLQELQTLLYPYSPLYSKIDESTSSGCFRKQCYLKNISVDEVAFCLDKSGESIRNYQNNVRQLNSVSIIIALKISLILERQVKDIFKI